MKLASQAKAAANNLFYSAFRTLLAMMGIMVGTASVVALVSSGNLAAQKALELFKSLGTEQMALYINPKDRKNNKLQIKTASLFEMKAALPQIRMLAPYSTDGVQFSYKDKMANVSLVGSTDQLAEIIKIKFKQGRFFSDYDKDTNYCIIGSKVAEKIQYRGLLGQPLRLGHMVFVIIGIADTWPENYFFGSDVNNSVIVPLSLMKLITQSNPTIRDAILELKPGVDPEAAKADITEYFRSKLPAFNVTFQSAKELIDRMNKQQATLTLLLVFIGGISLFVGGIGVMNIMLASISERRYEIGLRLALGAQPKDIQMMFLMEALILSMMGGGFGVILGILATYIVAFFSDWDFTIFVLPCLIGFVFSVLVTVVFGFYPAYKGSTINPIDALKSS